MEVIDVDEWFSGPRVCDLAGVTYRQLDYWVRTGLVTPSIVDSHRSGVHRRFSRDDVLLVAALGRLDVALTLRRPFADAVREAGGMRNARWVVIDGNWSVALCSTDDELRAAVLDATLVTVVCVDTLVEFDDARA